MGKSDADIKRLYVRQLDIQKCILDALKNLALSTPPGTGLATEVTLDIVSNTLINLLAENKLDFEMKSVKDVNGDVFQLRGTLDEETGIFAWDYIDAAGAIAVPVAPITFLNPDGLLTNIITEIQTLKPAVTALSSSSTIGSGNIPAGSKAASVFIDGAGGQINGVARPNGWSQVFEFNNDTLPLIPYNGNGTATIYVDILT